ncbi:MAG: hypothetical protein OXK17_05130 [Thaumarchaeota archaeon]|nr:hypothetical protein [Nitrososphaerota archaeon]
MVEVLVLTSLAVVGVGVIGVWLGIFEEGGWRTGAYDKHCTMDATIFENVGGGLNYLRLYITNTGTHTITELEIVTGSVTQLWALVTITPGDSHGVGFSSTHMRPELVTGVVKYADGSTSICENRWSLGVVG